MDLTKSKQEELRAYFTDTTLAVGVIIGSFTTFTTILRDYPLYIDSYTYARVGLFLVFIGIYLYRRRLSGNQKVALIISSLSVQFYLSVINLGFFSALKMFVILGPVVMVFILPRVVTIMMAGLLTVIYLYGSWNLMAGISAYSKPPSELLTDIYHWITELGPSMICILTMVIMISRFRSDLNKSITEIESQNEKMATSQTEIDQFNSNLEKLIDEKTLDLKKAVEDIAAQNRELKAINSGIQQYNKEITEVTSRLNLIQERVVLSDKMASLGILTAGVCHEIKNPLNHLYGSSKILEDYLRSCASPSDQLKLVDVLNTGVQRIKTIMESLNQFDHSSNRSGDWVNLVTVIENCRRILNHFFKPGIAYEFVTNVRIAEMQISSDVLHQVVLNILQNAVESFSEEGKVNITLLTSDEKAIIEISDNGCGIPDDIRNKVTDPFFSTKATDLHTGLGLYHVQKMMNDIGGKMIIDSETDRGTIVRLVFIGLVRK
jgi:signal transduction histidine kinase